MTKSKLSESLLRTIEGGNQNNMHAHDIEEGDEFERALTASNDVEMSDGHQTTHEHHTGDDMQLDDDSEPNAKAADSNEDNVAAAHSRTQESAPEFQADTQESPRQKPTKIKPEKSKTAGKFIGACALVVSMIAIAIGGYSVASQKKLVAENELSRNSVDQALGNLTTKADDITVDVIGAKKEIQRNKSAISSMDYLGADMNEIKTALKDIRTQMNEMKQSIEANTKSIEVQQLNIDTAKESMESLSTRVTIQRQPVRRAPSPASSTVTSAILEGARVASIDLWGSESSVMLKESNGNWLPLSDGDYFKGWRLEGTEDGVAIFRRGDKTTRLVVEE
jgi:methyl-accepting chemotaxis protein